MAKKDPEIEALDREFNRADSTMHVDEYKERLAAIKAREPWEVTKQAAAREANETAERDAKFVTVGQFNNFMREVGGSLVQILARINSRITSMQARADEDLIAKNQVSAPAKTSDDALTRIAALEFKVGALALHLGRGNPEGVQDLEKLMQRITDLEERLPLSYGGTWSEGQQSVKGVFYTDHGALWYCKETTRDRPGKSGAFQLAVKKGRDAQETVTVR